MTKLNDEIEKLYSKLLQYQLDKDWKKAIVVQRRIEGLEEMEEDRESLRDNKRAVR